jgi:hypothetical protein
VSEERDFYVSMIRDRKYALMAGPFATHEEALKFVEPVKAEASRLDPRCDFDAFGTCSKPRHPDNKMGWLNIYVGATPRPTPSMVSSPHGGSL